MNEHDHQNPDEVRDSDDRVVVERKSFAEELRTSEDWWAVYLGATLLGIAFLALLAGASVDADGDLVASHLEGWVAKPGKWVSNPFASIYPVSSSDTITDAETSKASPTIIERLREIPLFGVFNVFLIAMIGFGLGIKAMGHSLTRFLRGFWFVFLLAALAYVLTGQVVVKSYNLEYALWALGLGLLISNTIGIPKFAQPAVQTEFYIKTGLVILGAEVLLGKLIILGIPGICVAWIVTPVVLISTYLFGQKVLKMESKSLNMVISADMSVCGVSAAIATASACRAKKEELSFAVGLSLAFTVIMMIVLPAIIKACGMSEVLGGAWLGGTIDSTGAVAVAGAVLGETAKEVAITVKLIQNILIGVTAFGVAAYWVTAVDRRSGVRPDASEIWRRFPKFILGFIGASVVFSIIAARMDHGTELLDLLKGDCTKILRGWFFCLAFVSIGLESNFRDLSKFLKGSKPLVLYACVQSLNLLLTLAMAWLMFEVVFREALTTIHGG